MHFPTSNLKLQIFCTSCFLQLCYHDKRTDKQPEVANFRYFVKTTAKNFFRKLQFQQNSIAVYCVNRKNAPQERQFAVCTSCFLQLCYHDGKRPGKQPEVANFRCFVQTTAKDFFRKLQFQQNLIAVSCVNRKNAPAEKAIRRLRKTFCFAVGLSKGIVCVFMRVPPFISTAVKFFNTL